MEPIIELKNLGKKYNIQHQRGGYIALRDVLTNISKHPFAFAGQKAKNVIGLQKKEEFWALKDVNISINKGEVIGIIGSNGAGKSTLLKILTGITLPTEGEAILRGHVSSLLEVGTGFHPELTGRENIFLNGAILGMKRQEIQKNFDSIVEFAGVEKFIDTPVKRYSSGMYVRLAFSVAAHIEPDILLVDEVLAVGDTEFQKKCLGKMDEATKKQGRTILFVSHNMAAIQSLCQKTILLEHGRVAAFGKTSDVIDQYVSMRSSKKAVFTFPDDQHKDGVIQKISLHDHTGAERFEFPISKPFSIEVDFRVHTTLDDAVLSVLFYSNDRDLLLYSSTSDISGSLSTYESGSYHARVDIPPSLFNAGMYSFDVLLHRPNLTLFSDVRDIVFEVKNIDNPRSIVFQGNHMGKIALPLSYTIKKV